MSQGEIITLNFFYIDPDFLQSLRKRRLKERNKRIQEDLTKLNGKELSKAKEPKKQGKQSNLEDNELLTETDHIKFKKTVEFIQAEWSALALVVNRVMLVVFFLTMIFINVTFVCFPTNDVTHRIK